MRKCYLAAVASALTFSFWQLLLRMLYIVTIASCNPKPSIITPISLMKDINNLKATTMLTSFVFKSSKAFMIGRT